MAAPAGLFNRGMGGLTEDAVRHTIAVAVQPPILGELLRRALRAAAYDVVLVEADSALTVTHYDLAVVTGEPCLDAEVVIRLPEEGTRSGTARHPLGVEIVDVGDVSAVVDAVRRFA